MNAIRVNIQTGEVTTIIEKPSRYVVRVCERCHHTFEVRKDTKTKHCSMSCAKKGQRNRLGSKHSEITKQKLREVKTKNAKKKAKLPHFVGNNTKWAVTTYAKYKGMGKIPHNRSDEYGLYKYGEWIFNNERHDQK